MSSTQRFWAILTVTACWLVGCTTAERTESVSCRTLPQHVAKDCFDAGGFHEFKMAAISELYDVGTSNPGSLPGFSSISLDVSDLTKLVRWHDKYGSAFLSFSGARIQEELLDYQFIEQVTIVVGLVSFDLKEETIRETKKAGILELFPEKLAEPVKLSALRGFPEQYDENTNSQLSCNRDRMFYGKYGSFTRVNRVLSGGGQGNVNPIEIECDDLLLLRLYDQLDRNPSLTEGR